MLFRRKTVSKMATMKRPKGSTFRDYLGFAGGAAFCGWPVLLGIWVNAQSGQAGQATDYFVIARGAAVAILGAGSCHVFLHSLGKLHVARAVLSLLFFVPCLAVGLCLALTAVTNGSATIRDQKSSQKVAADDKGSLQDRRNAQTVVIAESFRSHTLQRAKIQIGKEEIVSSIESKIETYKDLARAGYLKYTDGCKPEQMYPQAQDFCDGLKELNAKKDAAVERDSLQKLIDAKGDASAPASMDPFADVMAFMLSKIGYEEFGGEDKEGEKKKAQLGLAKDWGMGVLARNGGAAWANPAPVTAPDD